MLCDIPLGVFVINPDHDSANVLLLKLSYADSVESAKRAGSPKASRVVEQLCSYEGEAKLVLTTWRGNIQEG